MDVALVFMAISVIKVAQFTEHHTNIPQVRKLYMGIKNIKNKSPDTFFKFRVPHRSVW